MIHFIFGILAVVIYWWLHTYSVKNNIVINLWGKLLSVLGILYTVFVAEVIVSFIHEREYKAALVIGVTTGILAIIWAVLLWRFLYSKQRVKPL